MFLDEIDSLKSVILSSETISDTDKSDLLKNLESLTDGLLQLDQTQFSEEEKRKIHDFLVSAVSTIQAPSDTSSSVNAINDFEVTYPKLTESINRLASLLSNLGI